MRTARRPPTSSTSVEVDDVEFVACSGAVTANFFDEQRIRLLRERRHPRAAAARRDLGETDIVTLTIGGNDIDFAGKVRQLPARRRAASGCSSSTRRRGDDPLLTWDLLRAATRPSATSTSAGRWIPTGSCSCSATRCRSRSPARTARRARVRRQRDAGRQRARRRGSATRSRRPPRSAERRARRTRSFPATSCSSTGGWGSGSTTATSRAERREARRTSTRRTASARPSRIVNGFDPATLVSGDAVEQLPPDSATATTSPPRELARLRSMPTLRSTDRSRREQVCRRCVGAQSAPGAHVEGDPS